MAIVRGTLYFAPDIKMAEVDFDDHDALISAFAMRIKGLFIEPVLCLRGVRCREGVLFASALLTAALIESLARIEGLDEETKPIALWLAR